MDENASRAVFIGVSVFVAVITLTLILNFYRTAKEEGAVANRYDISATDNNKLYEILSRENINGMDLRYLINCYSNVEGMEIEIRSEDILKIEKGKLILTNPNPALEVRHEYWDSNSQSLLDKNIRSMYNFKLEINSNKTKIKATFLY